MGGLVFPWNTFCQLHIPTYNKAYHYAYGIEKANLIQTIQILASDSLQGRETGTIGERKAASFLFAKMKEAGLLPVGDQETYALPYEICKTRWSKLVFIVNEGILIPGKDYFVKYDEVANDLKLSIEHLLFAGYGINRKDYDDYTYIQPQNEIIFVLDSTPSSYLDKEYKQKKGDTKTIEFTLEEKIKTALSKKAKALFVIIDSISFQKINTNEYLKNDNYSLDSTSSVKIPIVYLNEAALYKFLSKPEQKRLAKYIKNARNGKISSNFINGTLSVSFKKTTKQFRSNNLIGLLPGHDPQLKNEYIILSAHYDHLGKSNKQIYNGADDNASGIAALCEIAKALSKYNQGKEKLKRSVLFLFFSGEEKGQLGSQAFIRKPFVPLSQIKVNIILDMIGRTDTLHKHQNHHVYLIGADKVNPKLDVVIKAANAATINYEMDHAYNDLNHTQKIYLRSDHYTFSKNKIPSAFFFGGFHEDYHKPTDDVHKLNFQKIEDLSKLIYFTTLVLSNESYIIW